MKPTGALDFLSRVVSLHPRDYGRLPPEDKPAAFTIPGVDSLAVVEMIQREILSSLRDGETFSMFYRRSLVHFARAQVTPPGRLRLELLFHTTIGCAYSAGRAEQLLDSAARSAMPWWQYRAVGDSRTRTTHAALDGLVARWDDPVWRTFYPLNGPGCRCKVVALLTSQARDRAGEDLDTPALDRLPSGLSVRFPHTVLPFVTGERPFLRR